MMGTGTNLKNWMVNENQSWPQIFQDVVHSQSKRWMISRYSTFITSQKKKKHK